VFIGIGGSAKEGDVHSNLVFAKKVAHYLQQPNTRNVTSLLVQYTACGFFAFASIPFIVVPVSWTETVTNFFSLGAALQTREGRTRMVQSYVENTYLDMQHH
jgi:hypothetical protein